MIHTTPGMVDSLLHEELGSGFLEEEDQLEGSGHQDDDGLYMDDEDLSSDVVSSSNSC